MRFLIVNADDFGYSQGINRGILKAFSQGIVTSTSVLVDGSAAKEVRELSELPSFSIGLHFNISNEKLRKKIVEGNFISDLEEEIIKRDFSHQVKKFKNLLNQPPHHLDSHKHIHFHPQIKPFFKEYARKNKIPVRAIGGWKLIDLFWGRDKKGKTDLKRIKVDYLLEILAGLREGVNELMCHPGFADERLKKISSYCQEREVKLQTLIDVRIKDYINNSGIQLINWKEACLNICK